MKQKVKLTIFLGVVLLLTFLGLRFNRAAKERTFHFTYEVTLPKIEDAGELVRLWVPLPQTNHYQTISNLKVDSPVPVMTGTEPTYGNLMVHLSAESPLATGLGLTISFDVARKEQGTSVSPLTTAERELFLSPVSKVPRDPRFEEIAQNVLAKNKTILENGRALYNHILGRMEYDKSGVGWGRGDAIYACDIGKGNCTDYHSLFNAVARTADIPARFLIGFPIAKGKKGTIGGYNCWAEFYVANKGWVPVDISEADKHPEREDYLFGNLDPDRVMFTIGRDVELVPSSENGAVNFFIYPVLEINGIRSENYIANFHINRDFYDKLRISSPSTRKSWKRNLVATLVKQKTRVVKFLRKSVRNRPNKASRRGKRRTTARQNFGKRR